MADPLAFYSLFVNPGDLVFDIGAHERGHKAAAARDFEQRDTIKALRAAIRHVVDDSPGTPDSVKKYLREGLQ